MAIKDFCSLKTHPRFFCTKIIACCSVSEEKHRDRQIEPNSGAYREERARFSSGCTSLPLLCSCLLVDVRYLQTATQLTALLATCRWLSCVHAGQVFAQTQARKPHSPVFLDHHPCPTKIYCLMTTDLSDTHLDS